MARSGVNNSARERAARVKEFYDNPDMRRPFEDFTLARNTSTVFTITDRVGGIETDAQSRLEIGQRLRLEGTDGETNEFWEGFITDVVQSPSNICTVTVAIWDAVDSEDETGPLLVPAYIEVGPKELGTASWYEVGPSAGKLPLFDDLDPHVIIPEVDLDVGKLGGSTREEISHASARGRINANGDFGVWQRGDTFTSLTTGYLNDDDNVCADNWTILSDGNDVVDIARDSTDFPPGIGVSASLRMTVATVNKAHGVITFIEKADGLDIADSGTLQKCSLSFWVKEGATTGVGAIRAYVLNMKTEIPTTSPVAAWASAGVNHTFDGADWELPEPATPEPYLAVSLTSGWTEYKIEGIDLDRTGVGVGGLAIAFLTDDNTMAVASDWHLAAVQINLGDKALPFIRQPAAVERLRCERYFQWTGDEEEDRPAHGIGVEHALVDISTNLGGGPPGVDFASVTWPLSAMFKLPTLVTYNWFGTPSVAGDDWSDGEADPDGSFDITASTVNRKLVHITTEVASQKTLVGIIASCHANIWGNN